MLTDDQGYGDLSINGNPVLTPNIGRIAREGVRFTDFHVTPVYTPTRAELLTGADCLRNLACAPQRRDTWPPRHYATPLSRNILDRAKGRAPLAVRGPDRATG